MKSKIYILCPGAGRDFRGFEAHAIGLLEKLKDNPDFDVFLVKSGGIGNKRELKIGSLYRQSLAAKVLGSLFRRNPYIIQTLTFFLFFIRLLSRRPADILYVYDPPLYHYLSRWRTRTKKSFVMIFNTSGDTVPVPFGAIDILQAVTPEVSDLAKNRGIPEDRIQLLPHFIDLLPEKDLNAFSKKPLRQELGLPDDRMILLSVGAVDIYFKRMDYVVREVRQLKVPFFLVILGEREPETGSIEKLAKSILPVNSYIIKRVPRASLKKYYQAADMFTLASLREGFGMASLEALSYGLPVLLHPHPNAEYLIGAMGYYADFNIEGNLKRLIESTIPEARNLSLLAARKKYVEDKFSWLSLEKEHFDLFRKAEYSAHQP